MNNHSQYEMGESLVRLEQKLSERKQSVKSLQERINRSEKMTWTTVVCVLAILVGFCIYTQYQSTRDVYACLKSTQVQLNELRDEFAHSHYESMMKQDESELNTFSSEQEQLKNQFAVLKQSLEERSSEYAQEIEKTQHNVCQSPYSGSDHSKCKQYTKFIFY